MRETLLAAVSARIAQRTDQGDSGAVLGPGALAEADRLLACAASANADASANAGTGTGAVPDIEVLRTVGLLRWYRYLDLPEGQEKDDLRAAVELLQPVYDHDPGRVPEQLREYYDGQAAKSGGTARDDGRSSAGPEQRNAEGCDLFARYLRTGDLDALFASARLLAEAAEGADGHPDQARYLSNLSNVLRTVFEHTQNAGALDEAVTLSRAAVAATSDGHPDKAAYLSNLGLDLCVQFEATGDVDALHDALDAFHAAETATPDGHPDKADRIADLDGALRTLRANRSGSERNFTRLPRRR
jgi:hypothetical protein